MTIHLMARRAYARPDVTARNPRAVEYDLLAKCTADLNTAWHRRDTEFSVLAKAIDANLRLWTVLGADVADPSNALPQALRAQLFYLYEFTAEHSRAILEGRSSVGVLVDINTAVMRGLRGERGTA